VWSIFRTPFIEKSAYIYFTCQGQPMFFYSPGRENILPCFRPAEKKKQWHDEDLGKAAAAESIR